MNGHAWIDIALIENTALKGAQIALAYAELAKKQGAEPRSIASVRSHISFRFQVMSAEFILIAL